MKTVTLGGYTDAAGTHKGGEKYAVKGTYTTTGEGAPLSLIIGEPKKDGKKPRKSGSTPRPVGLSRMDTPKNTDTMQIACAGDERPHLAHVHLDGSGRMIATDGFRIHMQSGDAKPCPVCEAEGHNYPDVDCVFPRDIKIAVTLDAAELKAAFIRAGIFAREGSNVARVNLNGHAEIVGISEEYGAAKTDIEYLSIDYKIVYELAFAINWQLARDAINHAAPKGGKITVKAQSKVSPVIFEGEGGRIALVMPMHLG